MKKIKIYGILFVMALGVVMAPISEVVEATTFDVSDTTNTKKLKDSYGDTSTDNTSTSTNKAKTESTTSDEDSTKSSSDSDTSSSSNKTLLGSLLDKIFGKKTGKVTVKYLSSADNSKLNDDVVQTGKIGEDYATPKKEIPNYKFAYATDNNKGKYTKEDQTVTYYYTKDDGTNSGSGSENTVKTGQVTVKYLDKATNNSIAKDYVIKGNVGDTFSTQANDNIPGYTYAKKSDGNTEGKIAEAPQTVTYYYNKNTVNGKTVTVHYLDTDTKKQIASDITLNGNKGDSYNVDDQKIDGYKFQSVEGGMTGTFDDTNKEVTLYYEKTDGSTSTDTDDKNTTGTGTTTDGTNTTTPDTSANNNVGTTSNGAATQAAIPTSGTTAGGSSTGTDGTTASGTSADSAKLPQTSDKKENSYSFIILGLVLILLPVIILFRNKKKTI